MDEIIRFPKQRLSYKAKTEKWRKECVNWALSRTYFNYSPVRHSVRNMKINQDLVNGIIHMDDLMRVLNPSDTKADYIPDAIQHYPIINSKLEVLQGEEAARAFDWKVVVTNPNAISEIENNKKREITARLQELIEDQSQSEDEFNQKLEQLSYFFEYEWQDMRETRANALLNHYIKELSLQKLFNDGFFDALKFGEEIYSVDIIGGEPVVERLNPMKVHVFRSGYDNRIENADIVILEDFWSPSKVVDRYYDELKPDDIKYIEEVTNSLTGGAYDENGNYDETKGFIHRSMVSDTFEDEDFYTHLFDKDVTADSLLPYDMLGNIRVIRMFWKSYRKIKKIKFYDADGSTNYRFEPEDYLTKEEQGEEEKILWINEAWEGTLIGEKVYVCMRRCPIQYNRLTNPSRCHFGIFGRIYNKNDDRPYSMVDRMKPYSYMYDIEHDRLNKLMERNWGKIITLDLAMVPEEWEIDKWMYYAKVNGIAVKDSLKESNYGKPVGSLNNNSSGVIDAELGNTIQQKLTYLQFLKGELSEAAGISPQREGQVANRETVGGVERATLQSSHITEWLFVRHEDLKKSVLEGVLEASKIGLKGGNLKFPYLLSEGQTKIMDIDGDEFAECDYGLVIDNGHDTQKLNQQIDTLSQAALQNGYSLTSVMRMFSSVSINEKIRILQREERERQQQAQQQQQQEIQLKQMEIEQRRETEQARMDHEYKMNQENNDTKILVAEINSQAEADRLALMNGDDDGVPEMSEEGRARIKEMARQFDAKQKLEREKLNFEKEKTRKDQELKARQISKTNTAKK